MRKSFRTSVKFIIVPLSRFQQIVRIDTYFDIRIVINKTNDSFLINYKGRRTGSI